MTNALTQAFTYGQKPVRTNIVDGEPWFCLADVAAVLEIRDPSNFMRSKWCDPQGSVKFTTPSEGGVQETVFINEANLYAIVMRSTKEEALSFQRWVTHEVLPQIRKTGSYSTVLGIPNDPIEALGMAVVEMRRQQRHLEDKVQEVDSRLLNLEERQAAANEAIHALPAPLVNVRDLTPRERCREAINQLVSITGISHHEAWTRSYQKYSMTNRCNLTVLAQNRNMDKIEYVEKLGDIESLYTIILTLIQHAQVAAGDPNGIFASRAAERIRAVSQHA